MLLRLWLENSYARTGNDEKQDLLIIGAETGLLSHPSTLECVSVILEYFSPVVDVDGLNLLACSVFELFDSAGCIFVHFALQ